jgi:nucleoid DNA-binding protein
MAELKTKENDANVEAFLNTVSDEIQKADAKRIMQIMQEVTGEKPKMWGVSIFGFGRYHYKYASGRVGDWMLCGISSRKQSISVYILSGLDHFDDLLQKLGKYKSGKGCLYIKRLADIDLNVLKSIIQESVDYLKRTYS